jgi:hypothetical protein
MDGSAPRDKLKAGTVATSPPPQDDSSLAQFPRRVNKQNAYSARLTGTLPNGMQTAQPIFGQQPFKTESLAHF